MSDELAPKSLVERLHDAARWTKRTPKQQYEQKYCKVNPEALNDVSALLTEAAQALKRYKPTPAELAEKIAAVERKANRSRFRSRDYVDHERRLAQEEAERNAADGNPETCPICGGKQWHHTTDCYLGIVRASV